MTRKHKDFTSLDDRPGKPDHTIQSYCPASAKWCRIHRYPSWLTGFLEHEYYPGSIPVPDGTYVKGDGTEGIHWKEIRVFCGPGAFYPKRGKVSNEVR